jgi:ATP-binding cassette, subfamily B, bacterial
VRHPLHVRAARRLWVLFFYGFSAGPAAMTLGIVLGVVSAVVSVSYTLGFKVVIDAIVAGHATGALLGTLLTGVLFSLSWTLSGVSALVSFYIGNLCTGYLSARVARLTTRIGGLEHHERPDFLERLDLLRDNLYTLSNAPSRNVLALQVALRMVTVVVLLATVDPILALMPLLAVFPVIGDDLAARRRERTDQAVTERRRLANALFDLASTPAQASELRSFGLREEIADRHRSLDDEIRREVVRSAGISALESAAGWLVYGAGFAGSILLLTLRAVHGQASYGDVVMVFALIRRTQQQMSQVSTSVSQLTATSRAAQYLFWLEDHARSVTAPTASPHKVPQALTDGIRLSGVSFSYPGTERTVLEDVSLLLPAGLSVALVGENGAGKTTLIKLLTGMYQPTAGSITVDDVPLREFDTESWRRRTTAAFQDFVRFELPAGEAVGIGDLPRVADDAAVVAALERAHGADLVAGLPDGLRTPLGRSLPKGRDLSGGQWQKLALGRAMMRERPLLLVLDEPTASLDAPTEAALFERYAGASRRGAERSGAVTLFVSHRFSTVRVADLIVVLHEGRVTEIGSHDELLALGGRYAELFELQARSYR